MSNNALPENIRYKNPLIYLAKGAIILLHQKLPNQLL